MQSYQERKFTSENIELFLCDDVVQAGGKIISVIKHLEIVVKDSKFHVGRTQELLLKISKSGHMSLLGPQGHSSVIAVHSVDKSGMSTLQTRTLQTHVLNKD